MSKEKKLLFIKHGAVEGKHFEYRHKEQISGNAVIFMNGSLQSGFEDNCSAVIMDCENDRVKNWAVKKGFRVEDMEGNNLLSEHVIVDEAIDSILSQEQENADDNDDDDDFGPSVDELVQSQVARAEVEHSSESTDPHEVPHISKVEVGKYKDPDGNLHERKMGPKLKDSFVEAIKKHGFDSFEKLEN